MKTSSPDANKFRFTSSWDRGSLPTLLGDACIAVFAFLGEYEGGNRTKYLPSTLSDLGLHSLGLGECLGERLDLPLLGVDGPQYVLELERGYEFRY